MRLVAEGDERGAELALSVVREVLELEPLVALARKAAQPGALQVAQALRACEMLLALMPVATSPAMESSG